MTVVRESSYDAIMPDEKIEFPSLEEVERANREQLGRWYRFLPTGGTAEQRRILDRIATRFKSVGGMTPALSKKIGY